MAAKFQIVHPFYLNVKDSSPAGSPITKGLDYVPMQINVYNVASKFSLMIDLTIPILIIFSRQNMVRSH